MAGGQAASLRLGCAVFIMRTLLLLSLAATAVNALMPSEMVAAGGRASNHSSAFSSFGNLSRPCSGPDPEFFCNRDDKCIPMALHCDEKDDCSDGEDEIGCKLKCDKAHLFACEYILVCN